ncbi:hypothetical protein GCM10027048_27530 [Hymenobacter coalescens]
MKAAKLTQKELARVAQIAPTQLSEVLSGRRPMTAAFCLTLEANGIGDAEIWLFMYLRHELDKLRKVS